MIPGIGIRVHRNSSLLTITATAAHSLRVISGSASASCTMFSFAGYTRYGEREESVVSVCVFW